MKKLILLSSLLLLVGVAFSSPSIDIESTDITSVDIVQSSVTKVPEASVPVFDGLFHLVEIKILSRHLEYITDTVYDLVEVHKPHDIFLRVQVDSSMYKDYIIHDIGNFENIDTIRYLEIYEQDECNHANVVHINWLNKSIVDLVYVPIDDIEKIE